MHNYKVGVAGFRGYSGAELLRLLDRHPHVSPVIIEHRDDPEETTAPGPRRPSVACTPQAARDAELAVVFLATPPEVSMQIAPGMLEAGVKVIDLSGAFRLRDAATYTRWYKEDHTAPQLIREAVYGLPEFCRDRIRGARLIANPGCYPTAANLAIRPLIDAGIVDRECGMVCDAKSGVSGAGRKPSLKTSFCEVAGNFSAYSVLDHRHVAEILMVSGVEEKELSFTAQLIPIDRGILETIYFRTKKVSTAEALLDIYRQRYANEKFVRIHPAKGLPDVHSVDRTNFCDIGMRFDAATGRAVVVSVIDNLVKGAAGQALQNMNLVLGLEETAGLL